MDDNKLLTMIRDLIIEHNEIMNQIQSIFKEHVEEIKKIREGVYLIYDQM